MFQKDRQYVQFCLYGFLKNLRIFEPFLILFLAQAGMSFTQIGLLYAIREIARNLFEIPGGVFADSVGRKKSLLVAFSAYLVSFIGFYFSNGFWPFACSFLLYALGDAFRTGTHKAMIMSYLNHKAWAPFKVDYYGHTRSWSQMGSALSALLAGAVVLLTGQYRIAFLLATIPYLLELINLSLYPGYLDRPGGQIAANSVLKQLKQTSRDFMVSIRDKTVLNSIFSLSLYTGYYKASKDYIQPLIQLFALGLPLFSKHSTIQREGLLVGLVYFLLFLTTSTVSRNSGHWVRKQKSVTRAMRISLTLGAAVGLLSGLCVLLDLRLLAIVFFAGIYFFENLRKPIGIGQIADHLDEKVLASALSVESQAETIFSAIFAVLMGFLVDELSLGLALLIISALVLMGPYIGVLKQPVNDPNSPR